MAVVVENSTTPESGIPGVLTYDITVTNTGDTLTVPLGTIDNVQATNKTTEKGVKVAVSGQVITFTCTTGDNLYVVVWGRQ